jgi:DNA-binding NtrC family response regulator
MEQSQSLHILVVDDESIVRVSLKNWFEEDGHVVQGAADAKEALRLLTEKHWDLALVDIKMPGMDGLELQRRILEASPDTTVIIMTAFASVETAVQALKEGALDYVTKPFDPERLSHLIRNTAQRHKLVRENIQLKHQLASVVQPTPILGESPSIKRVIKLIETVAPTDATVLITGESGTGKELVARAIHANSPRAYMPLVVVNCGALPQGTLESELFGHERGAFTGAQFRHKGKFELADGGTLFLDEISEITQKSQVELLRVLEDKQVTRLGGAKPVATDFRTIAATNKDLAVEVEQQRFRDDLFYRLNVFQIDLPPLRARAEDIPILARAFVARLAQSMNRPMPEISTATMEVLSRHVWPGNVRELANAMERAMVVCRTGMIRPQDLPISCPTSDTNHAAGLNKMSLAAAEKRHVETVLRESEWNITRAARILDVDRTTIYNKIKQYGLTKS